MPASLPSLNLVEIQQALAGTKFAAHLHHLPTVTSTNTLALEAAQSGVSAGVWIADEQTAGRGRGGHTWHSPSGAEEEPAGLYLSTLVRPRLPLNHALWLSLATGLAARRAIAATAGITPDIRWPNDLLLNSKKCGGILVETASNPPIATQPATLRYAVIGIGVNLNHRAFPPELASLATSIALETGASLPREPLIIALLHALDQEIASLESPTASDILTRFTAASTWITGKRVRVEPRAGNPDSYTGTTAGLDPSGFLRVLGDDGNLHTVLSGGLREP